ncbi:sensor histidine kinase [Acidithiobacillus sulfuriphilus]|uniref:sensor histidine kinase n=1 Tax=Acidithiobacillus sulfuriphilus TaxID=1867749 RepID=UPI003F5EC412
MSDVLPFAAQETAWIEVIHKMDETYADLVRYQVELEKKNVALEEAQHFLASILASMTDVLIVCDLTGAIQQVNRALEDLTGLSADQLLGRPFQSLFTQDSQLLVDGFAQCIRDKAIHDCALQLRGRDEPVPVDINCTSRYDHRKRLVGMVLLGRPVGELHKAYRALNQAHTELKTAQKQLVQSEKMASLGRLVAGVAHELNNPISFIYGNVHALDRYARRLARYIAFFHEQGPGADQDRLRGELRIDRILDDLSPLITGTMEGAERVRDIVQGLRQFSSGKQGEYALFDVEPVLRRAVHWVSKGGPEALAVDYDLPASLRVFGHAGQIQQVLMNLVQNALDAMADMEHPHLEIRGGEEGGGVWLQIRDFGPGIAEADLVQIFDPFFTTKPVGSGTGLGLAISYGIVNEHGGRLEAHNHPQGGAVFLLDLPSLRPGDGIGG